MPGRFRDRKHAGRFLARKLSDLPDPQTRLVLGLPRGGVPVALEIALALGAPLDILIVRKLGVPGFEEMAMGAIASGGAQVLDHDLIIRIGIPPTLIDRVIRQESQELARRESAYRQERPPITLKGRRIIVVDDGMATGATMMSAIQTVRLSDPAEITVAVPTASPEAARKAKSLVDRLVCPLIPRNFQAVGQCYDQYDQLNDAQVRALLLRAWARLL